MSRTRRGALLAVILSVLAGPWAVPARAQDDTFIVPGGTRQEEPPVEAGKRLDEAHRKLWESLTPAEREEIWKQFEDAVGPDLKSATDDYQRQAQTSGAGANSLFAPGPEPFQPVTDALPPTDAGPASGAVDRSTDPLGVAAKADNDGDGLPDNFERQVADNFTPAYYISLFERGGTGLSLFQDRPDAEVPRQVFPTSGPPVATSYYRVTTLGKVNGRGYLQIDYLSLWNRDDGLPLTPACGTDINLLSFFGIWSSAFAVNLPGHSLDNERSAVRIFAPLVGGAYSTDSNAYRIDKVFTAAHEDTIIDRSDLQSVSPPRGPVAHPVMFLSLGKHGSYLFWPHGLVSLLPGFAVASIYGGVTTACFFVSPSTCDLLFFIADEVVFDCIVEKHVPQGWVLARSDLRTNVGEVSRPLPGGNFILVTDLRNKLQKRFAIP